MIEKTLILLKPDAIGRKLIGKIINILEEADLLIKEIKTVEPEIDQLKRHYNHLPEDILRNVILYMTSDLIAMSVEGENAISKVRKLVGDTQPLEADIASIRGRFSSDSYAQSNNEGRAIFNLIHASDSVENAKREYDIWFKYDNTF
jgi:nucleoside-diphosphate kinase